APFGVTLVVGLPCLNGDSFCSFSFNLTVGDVCNVTSSIPGICRTINDCEPLIDGYIKTGALSLTEVPSCGLTVWGEIICCPTRPCCGNGTTSTTTTTTTTTTTARPRPRGSIVPNVRLSEDSTDRPAVAGKNLSSRMKENYQIYPILIHTACKQMQEEHRLRSLGHPRLVIHIVGGVPVDPGVYPHMAAIAFVTFDRFEFRCGGSLISKRFVLTAAHCVYTDSLRPAFVRLGAVNVVMPDKNYVDVNVRNVTIHPNYVGNIKYNDVAILELANEITETDNIRPACLHTDPRDPPVDSKLFVAGWGVLNVTTRVQSKILLRAALELVPLAQCNVSYSEQPGAVRNLKEGVIDSLMCAADKKQQADACQGDSGGPLIREVNIEDGIYTIVGIINSGFGCATKTPGLYTRVASFLDFIERIVWPDN
ncbi:hypothetical protein KR038_002465, partial [Drosophila bunnanda]